MWRGSPNSRVVWQSSFHSDRFVQLPSHWPHAPVLAVPQRWSTSETIPPGKLARPVRIILRVSFGTIVLTHPTPGLPLFALWTKKPGLLRPIPSTAIAQGFLVAAHWRDILLRWLLAVSFGAPDRIPPLAHAVPYSVAWSTIAHLPLSHTLSAKTIMRFHPGGKRLRQIIRQLGVQYTGTTGVLAALTCSVQLMVTPRHQHSQKVEGYRNRLDRSSHCVRRDCFQDRLFSPHTQYLRRRPAPQSLRQL
jgi:hypothetical protein